jgi:PAS domain S-box-containing protein
MKTVSGLDSATLERMLELVPEFVLIVDRAGMILYINHVEPGYQLEAVIGTQADAIMLPESQLVFRATLDSVFSTGGTEEYEVSTTAPDGSLRWYRSLRIRCRSFDFDY